MVRAGESKPWAAYGVALTSVEDKKMSNPIRDQFVRDMQVAGLQPGTQKRYLSCVHGFLKATWTGPESATEQQVQDFLIALRERQVARETFRGHRYALQFLFVNTLGRDWALFKKNCGRRRKSAFPKRFGMRNVWPCCGRSARRSTGVRCR